jgi:hypothetical protein
LAAPFDAAATGVESAASGMASESGTRPARRVRRAPPPFSIRLTETEKQRLKALAGSRPVGAYIRERLLADDVSPRKTRRAVVQDADKLAALLALLAQSHLAQNLNQLAKHANMGTLNVTLDVVEELLAACAHVREMRATLISALGVKPENERP